jgi:hypothetical protein
LEYIMRGSWVAGATVVFSLFFTSPALANGAMSLLRSWGDDVVRVGSAAGVVDALPMAQGMCSGIPAVNMSALEKAPSARRFSSHDDANIVALGYAPGAVVYRPTVGVPYDAGTPTASLQSSVPGAIDALPLTKGTMTAYLSNGKTVAFQGQLMGSGLFVPTSATVATPDGVKLTRHVEEVEITTVVPGARDHEGTVRALVPPNEVAALKVHLQSATVMTKDGRLLKAYDIRDAAGESINGSPAAEEWTSRAVDYVQVLKPGTTPPLHVAGAGKSYIAVPESAVSSAEFTGKQWVVELKDGRTLKAVSVSLPPGSRFAQ